MRATEKEVFMLEGVSKKRSCQRPTCFREAFREKGKERPGDFEAERREEGRRLSLKNPPPTRVFMAVGKDGRGKGRPAGEEITARENSHRVIEAAPSSKQEGTFTKIMRNPRRAPVLAALRGERINKNAKKGSHAISIRGSCF